MSDLRAVRRTASALVAALCLFARGASADSPAPKRTLPDYDGREDPPATAGEVALWVPRVLLYPLYLTSEYLIRVPLGALITTAERHNWAPAIVDFFTFDPEHKSGLVPTAFFEFNFRPSGGLYFFWDDAIWKKNDVRVHAQIGGSDWLSFGALDRVHIGKLSTVGLQADFLRRPDYVFHGIGPRTLESDRSRYGMASVDVGLVYDLSPEPWVHFKSRVGAKTVNIGDGSFDDDPSLSVESRRGAFPLPPGFPEGYTAVYERAELALDSRRPKPWPGTGVRLMGHVDHGADVRFYDNPRAWVRYGGALGGFVDVDHTARRLGLVLNAEFEEAVRGATPFTELSMLGGSGGFAGFRPGRLVGQSSATASLFYEWPIWVWLDGAIHLGVGNVFGPHLEDFEARLLRLSWGIGIRSTGSPDHQIGLEIGFGTETIEDGLDVTSFRLAFGGTNGF
ncbi:MAG TPA: hypothetical protein VHC69_00155 [Polyangiaceae bacterium]|nr:hypothetical protein [Polyangiaceae bacterium]